MLQGGSLTPDSAQQLRYLQAVVLESLRLRPPAYIVGRCAAQSVRLGPHSLPAGLANSGRMCRMRMHAPVAMAAAASSLLRIDSCRRCYIACSRPSRL